MYFFEKFRCDNKGIMKLFCRYESQGTFYHDLFIMITNKAIVSAATL